MIIRETSDHFFCYKQPDHAVISGEAAKAWNKALLPSTDLFTEACYAIEHHDDGWTIPDEQPIWNDLLNQPASFVHFPLALKLHFYETGINALNNDYAKLLCSMHYASFFATAAGTAEKEFLLNEKIRQRTLLQAGFNDVLTDYHFSMLQFCDDLSLFICLHEPETKPEHYTDWFKNGFRHSEILLGNTEKIEIRWKTASDLQLIHSPLAEMISVLLPYKRISKKDCSELGIAATWKQTPVSHATFTLR